MTKKNAEFVEAPTETNAGEVNGNVAEQPEVSLTDDLATESLPSLSDFADDVGGPLPRGWYAVEIIDGYATRSGKQFLTEDSVSKDGASRNLRVCFRVPTGRSDGDTRNLQASFNYRASDFSPERLAFIKAKREEMAGVKGRWPDSDAQRSSLAIAKLGQLEKALGVPYKRTAEGLLAGPLVGAKLDIRLNINEDSFNDITAFAKLGTITSTPKKNA